MYDLEINMRNEPGQLALMGETLGAAGISVEGGGMFLVGAVGAAHFLVADGPLATSVLVQAGLDVAACREVLVQRLRQDEPGQLGTLCRAMADAGVNIEVLYSDHDHQLILVVDDVVAGRRVSDAWTPALQRDRRAVIDTMVTGPSRRVSAPRAGVRRTAGRCG